MVSSKLTIIEYKYTYIRQQDNATVEKKMRIVLFNLQIWRIFVIWEEKNRTSRSSWTHGHQVRAPFLELGDSSFGTHDFQIPFKFWSYKSNFKGPQSRCYERVGRDKCGFDSENYRFLAGSDVNGTCRLLGSSATTRWFGWFLGWQLLGPCDEGRGGSLDGS